MKIKYVLCIIFIISFQYNISIIPWGEIQSNLLILFETVENEQYGDHTEKRDYIINNQTDWEALWNISFYSDEHIPLPPLPSINFSITTVIGIYFGIKGTGGYSIQIYGIIEKEHNVIVYVKETEPYGIVTLAITHPFHIVKTKKLTKSITIIHYIDESYLVNRELIRWTLSISIITTIVEIIGNKIHFKRKKKRRKLER